LDLTNISIIRLRKFIPDRFSIGDFFEPAIFRPPRFAQLDFSWARLVAETPPQHLALMLPFTDGNLPWLGMLLGGLLGCYFCRTNQFIVQRAVGKRDIFSMCAVTCCLPAC